VLALLLAASAVGIACAPPVPHRGPIVLITIEALRADVVGALSEGSRLTPSLDALAEESQWSQPAIAASSWTLPSMASIHTGLQPWRHGSWHGERPELASKVETLAEGLKQAGYRTRAFRSNEWLTRNLGYDQGFDEFRDLYGTGDLAESALRRLGGGPEFIWIHVLPPHAPYLRHKSLFDRLDAIPQGLPEAVDTAELEAYFDPEIPLPDDQRDRFWALYQLHVAHADRSIGRLLDAIRTSGHWDETLLVVTADHGEEFGESGQIAHGGNLDRVLIEVPLLIKLPRSLDRTLTPRPWMGNLRVFATLLDAVGAQVPPEVEPSLFENDPRPALSELYLIDGVNTVSLVDAGEQVIRRARFHENEPEFFRARRLGITRDPTAVTKEHPVAIFDRVSRAFAATPPLSAADGQPVSAEHVSWEDRGAREVIQPDDPRSLRVVDTWIERNGPEIPPTELGVAPGTVLSDESRERLRALGYLVQP
jgi:arylsulfatase A-like enzyme